MFSRQNMTRLGTECTVYKVFIVLSSNKIKILLTYNIWKESLNRKR